MQIKELTDELSLTGLYQAFLEQNTPSYGDIPFEKRLQLLLEAESTTRRNRKIERLQRMAKLHEKSAAVEEIDFSPARGLDRGVILDLAGGKYIESHYNIILTDPTGTGKSYSAMYLRIPRLMQLLTSSKAEDEYLKILAKLKKVKLLILDDFGVSPLKASEARDLLGIVEDRTNLSSLIITSQLPLKEWHGYLHNPTIADAILDRVVHNAYKIELQGESQRKIKQRK